MISIAFSIGWKFNVKTCTIFAYFCFKNNQLGHPGTRFKMEATSVAIEWLWGGKPMYKTVEEKSVQKSDEKPFYKKVPRHVLFLIPTVLIVVLFGAIMGAIAGFMSTPEILEEWKKNTCEKSVKLLK